MASDPAVVVLVDLARSYTEGRFTRRLSITVRLPEAKRYRRATFLPQVAPDQNWDRETTLSRLARKAGLASDVWRTPACTLSVYEAQVFAEHGVH